MYTTTDLNCAAFLIGSGHTIKAVGGERGGKRVFEFDAEAEKDALKFFQNAAIPARDFAGALRDLKALIRI